MSDSLPPRAAPIRVAVMGAGHWGRNLVRVMGSLESADLSWIVDPDPEALIAASRVASRARAVSHIDDTGYDFDAAVVSTPASDHAEHALSLLCKRKHVLVEKPAAVSIPEAAALVDAASRYRSLLMVGHQLLFHPAFEALAALRRAGSLGAIHSIVSERAGAVDMAKEPGVIWSYGPHDAAMILYLTGADPSSIRAAGLLDERGLPVSADIDLGFPSGVEARIRLRANDGARVRKLTVMTERATLIFDDAASGGRLDVLTDGINPVSFTPAEPLTAECAHFIDAISMAREPRTGPEHIARVTRLLSAAGAAVAS